MAMRIILLALLVAVTTARPHVMIHRPIAKPITAEQVHISLGYSPSDIYVGYVTMSKPEESMVIYGQSPQSLHDYANATVDQFVDGGKTAKVRYMHNAPLLNLDLGVMYFYSVVVDRSVPTSSLPVYNFSTINPNRGFTEPLRIAMFGDYGVVNDRSHDRLQADALADRYDLIIHSGDMAYNLDDEEGDRGDTFMNMQQAFLSHVPYQVCPGNHESNYNFSHYRARYHMPSDTSKSNTNLYSSFNVGPVHFISISTELYFYKEYYNATHVLQQYEWLKQDLDQAVADRAQRPWIVVYGHRPLYCTDDIDDDPTICTTDTAALRDGVGFNGQKRVGALESIFYQYQVDFYFSGHMHSYERLNPVFKGQVLGQGYDPLIAPFQVIAGATGCQEELDTYDDVVYPWSAVRSDSYGYGVFTVYNRTHAHWEQILDEDGSVLDEAWLVKPGSKSTQSTSRDPRDPPKRRSSIMKKIQMVD